MNPQPDNDREHPGFFSISPTMLFPFTSGDFDVWLKQDDEYLLYTRGREGFTDRHRLSLVEHGIDEVYVHTNERDDYKEYVQRNLGGILFNEAMPMEERSKVFYEVSVEIVRDAFENKLPSQPDDRQLKRILELVSRCTDFLARRDSLKSLAGMISHDYRIYSHSINVMIYTLAILDCQDLDRDRLIEVGLGAMLHDMGKTGIPREVLNKSERLNDDELALVQRHPARGVAICSRIPLSQATIHCIMFHHERLDGLGYPAGLEGDKIPLEVRALSLADVYDALTSDKPYAQRVTPFQALRIMKDEMKGAFDPLLYRRLLGVLSGAGIVEGG